MNVFLTFVNRVFPELEVMQLWKVLKRDNRVPLANLILVKGEGSQVGKRTSGKRADDGDVVCVQHEYFEGLQVGQLQDGAPFQEVVLEI